MTARPTIIALALALAGCNMAPPPLVITNDKGGVLDEYIASANRMGNSGREIRITGLCGSACTVYLRLPNTCITPNATVAFHGARSAKTGQPSPLGNLKLILNYSEGIEQLFFDHAAHLQGSDAYYVSGAQLIALGEVRECQ